MRMFSDSVQDFCTYAAHKGFFQYSWKALTMGLFPILLAMEHVLKQAVQSGRLIHRVDYASEADVLCCAEASEGEETVSLKLESFSNTAINLGAQFINHCQLLTLFSSSFLHCCCLRFCDLAMFCKVSRPIWRSPTGKKNQEANGGIDVELMRNSTQKKTTTSMK